MSLKTKTAKIQQTELMRMRQIPKIAETLIQKTAARIKTAILMSLRKILLPDTR